MLTLLFLDNNFQICVLFIFLNFPKSYKFFIQ